MAVPSAIVFLLSVLLLCHLSTGKRPPKQSAKVTKVKGQSAGEASEVLDDASLTLLIEHSVGRGNEFYPRGTLHLKSLKTATVSSSFQQLPLPPSNLTSLRMSAKYGGYYFIRARSKFTDLLGEKEASADSGGEYVTTFISACALVNAGLSDVIIINGDGQGNIIGLTLSTPVVVTGMDCDKADEVVLPSQFNSSVSVDNGVVGPQPNTQAFFQKKEKDDRDQKDGKDNRSFLQKYWLYIVIAFVGFSLFNSMAGGGGGGGGGQ